MKASYYIFFKFSQTRKIKNTEMSNFSNLRTKAVKSAYSTLLLYYAVRVSRVRVSAESVLVPVNDSTNADCCDL